MFQYPYLELFYKENYSKLLDWKSPLRPSKSCPKNGAAGVAKFQDFYKKTESLYFNEDEVLKILKAENVEDGDTIFHQNLRVMRELNFVKPSGSGNKQYVFTEEFITFIESGHTVDCYIIEKLMTISSVDDLTMYFNFLICVMREAAIYGQVIQYRDSADKFAKDVPDEQKRKEHQKRIYDVYGFKGDEARIVPENYTPNISYFCHAVLKQLGILTKSDKKIDNMGTLVLTPLGEMILKKIDENLSQTPEIKKNMSTVTSVLNGEPLQRIFYGAPGTGKSYTVNVVSKRYPGTIRTTFHPDSDYSTFVGAYKPTSYKDNRYVMDGSNPIAMKYPDVDDEIKSRRGQKIKESRIEYRFVKQAFLKAYIKAWQLFSKAENLENVEPQFLVIEEINRGNCAQIFGDLFQLLDRKNGFSEYPIDADEDIHKSLICENTELDPSFGEEGLKLPEKQRDVINAFYNEGNDDFYDYADDICMGRILALPPNLYIWATMNTSDQSLFPIDSAFKRRWDWQYIKISEGKQEDSSTPLGWKILVEDEEQDRVRLYDWWRFLQLINTKIFGATESADKQMGYFFTKATESFSGNKLGVIKKEGVFVEETSQSPKKCDFITAEAFVNKVLFYLWTDVLKDNEYDEMTSLMKVGDKPLSFPDFFGETGKEISPEALRAFLDNVMKDEDVWCEVAEWTIVAPQTTGNGNTNTNGNPSSNFKSKSVIFKITENIQDPVLLYERARKSWRMADSRAMETQYFYVYSTPVREIKACYRVESREKVLKENGKYRYEFKGVLEENDPMINKPVEAISHSRGQVVFYPDNWGGVQTDDNNDKESLNENPV